MSYMRVYTGSLRLKAKEFVDQLVPIEEHCKCSTCRTTTRSYMHILFKENDALASQLLTKHNISYMMRLMRTMREAIINGEEAYVAFIKEFLHQQFPRKDIPVWVTEALKVGGIVLD